MIYPVPKSLIHTIIESHPSAIPCEFFPLPLKMKLSGENTTKGPPH